MRIFVAGGTGVVGRPLMEALVDQGHEVTASTSRAGNVPVLKALGARPVMLDGLDKTEIRAAIGDTRPEVVVNQITALSAPAHDYGAWLARTNRLRREGAPLMMAAARAAGVRRVVGQSASFMTGPTKSGPTDELSPLYLDGPEPLRSHVRANDAAERAVTGASGVEEVVLRYGVLYGQGTAIGPGGDIVKSVEVGEGGCPEARGTSVAAR